MTTKTPLSLIDASLMTTSQVNSAIASAIAAEAALRTAGDLKLAGDVFSSGIAVTEIKV